MSSRSTLSAKPQTCAGSPSNSMRVEAVAADVHEAPPPPDRGAGASTWGGRGQLQAAADGDPQTMGVLMAPSSRRARILRDWEAAVVGDREVHAARSAASIIRSRLDAERHGLLDDHVLAARTAAMVSAACL